MAYASVVSLAQTIEHILHHHDQNPSTSTHEKQHIESLREHVIFMQTFLEDFPGKATTSLEHRIRDASNAAEDTIEHFVLEEIRSYYASKSAARTDVRKERSVRYDFQELSLELRKVTQEVGSVVAEVMDIKNMITTTIKLNMQLSDSSVADDDDSSSGFAPRAGKDDVMVGFDDDLITIKTRLCGESSGLRVIPIVGMGGIGKTTLARSAYEDPLTTEYFHVRAWVTVSQDYSTTEILTRLQSSTEKFVKGQFEHSNGSTEDKVYQSLKGRRYLIVLDDIWNTEFWDDVKLLFPNDNNGSRIMLTTRLAGVAAYADSSSPLHEMRFMVVNQSWDLLKQKVFKKNHCPPELESAGMMIARSCRGLPLAIVVVAGILSTVSQTKASWDEVAENVISAVTTNDDHFAKIFLLSYTQLPRHLRPCFLYMGAFPEDYEIHVSNLIKLWTAEGFLKPCESKSFEDGAEEYLEELVRRSLVLVTRKKFDGKIKSCSVHDLVRNLCITKAKEEKFLLHTKDMLIDRFDYHPVSTDQRRVSITRSRASWWPNIDGPNIHTVLCFHDAVSLYSLRSFRVLRVLDAMKVKFKKFPSDVSELFLLRYLAFTFSCDIRFDIPPSILKLQNLQTLLIREDTRSTFVGARVRFPLEIWGMGRLRHLLVDDMYVPLPEPCHTSLVLQNLQTFATVKYFICTERILQMIPNLRKLSVFYQGDEIKWEEFQLDNLVHLHQLERLSIRVVKGTRSRIRMWGELRFPLTLKKLKLEGFLLRGLDMETICSLPNLEVLKLIGCSFHRFKWETTEGGFPKLKLLHIEDMMNDYWITEASHFPRLEHLVLYKCYLRFRIPDGFGEIPTLKLIAVSRWDTSLLESAIRIKEEQQNYGNDSFQVLIQDTYVARILS